MPAGPEGPSLAHQGKLTGAPDLYSDRPTSHSLQSLGLDIPFTTLLWQREASLHFMRFVSPFKELGKLWHPKSTNATWKPRAHVNFGLKRQPLEKEPGAQNLVLILPAS